VRRAIGGRIQRHIDVFEEAAWMNAAKAFARLDEVIAGLSRLFAAEGIDKDERLGELTGTHHEARAVDGPLIFNTHKFFTPLGRAAGN
jgi:hypothetical protein